MQYSSSSYVVLVLERNKLKSVHQQLEFNLNIVLITEKMCKATMQPAQNGFFLYSVSVCTE